MISKSNIGSLTRAGRGTIIDMSGKKFGRLLVISREENDRRGEARWKCLCDCGNVRVVLSSHLRSGRVVSCGCYAREQASKRANGHCTCSNYKHGYTNTRLYETWTNMKTRCLNRKNKNYKWYGALGVTICEPWISFEEFKNWALSSGYTDKLTIDRIDPRGNYEPANCRWVPINEQRKNQRRSHNDN